MYQKEKKKEKTSTELYSQKVSKYYNSIMLSITGPLA